MVSSIAAGPVRGQEKRPRSAIGITARARLRDQASKYVLVAIIGLCALPVLAFAAPAKHFPSGGSAVSGPSPAFSAAVQAGETLYVSGTTDGTDPDTGKLPVDATTGAKVVLNNVRKTLEAAGYTMDDLVWVQIFTSDLKYYGDFNAVYRTYFTGPLPARAFIGAGSLLGGAHFEVMGIAVKPTAAQNRAK